MVAHFPRYDTNTSPWQKSKILVVSSKMTYIPGKDYFY